jgi:hypothetical protein
MEGLYIFSTDFIVEIQSECYCDESPDVDIEISSLLFFMATKELYNKFQLYFDTLFIENIKYIYGSETASLKKRDSLFIQNYTNDAVNYTINYDRTKKFLDQMNFFTTQELKILKKCLPHRCFNDYAIDFFYDFLSPIKKSDNPIIKNEKFFELYQETQKIWSDL